MISHGSLALICRALVGQCGAGSVWLQPERPCRDGLLHCKDFTEIRDPKIDPQIVGFPYNKDPNKVPLISETPNLLLECSPLC